MMKNEQMDKTKGKQTKKGWEDKLKCPEGGAQNLPPTVEACPTHLYPLSQETCFIASLKNPPQQFPPPDRHSFPHSTVFFCLCRPSVAVSLGSGVGSAHLSQPLLPSHNCSPSCAINRSPCCPVPAVPPPRPWCAVPFAPSQCFVFVLCPHHGPCSRPCNSLLPNLE